MDKTAASVLHVYNIQDCDFVVASDADEARSLWRQHNASVGAEPYPEEDDDDIAALPDTHVLKMWTDDDGQVGEHGHGHLTRRTAAEWAQSNGKGFLASSEY